MYRARCSNVRRCINDPSRARPVYLKIAQRDPFDVDLNEADYNCTSILYTVKSLICTYLQLEIFFYRYASTPIIYVEYINLTGLILIIIPVFQNQEQISRDDIYFRA